MMKPEGRRSSAALQLRNSSTCSSNHKTVLSAMLVNRLSLLWGFALFALGLLATRAATQTAPASLSELRQRLTAQISQPKFAAALWGIDVVSLDTGKTLFEHNAGKLFSPASNSKLYTVALALDRLGPEYRIKTSLYSPTRPNRRGTLKGNLLLYGRGDPTLNARLHEGNIYQALEPLVDALTNAGVRRIAGDLVADESFIHGSHFGSGWAWDDLEYSYGAEISALTIEDNVLGVTASPGPQIGSPCSLGILGPPGMFVFSNLTETFQPGEKQRLEFFRKLDDNVLFVSGGMPLGAGGFTNEMPVDNPARLFLALFREELRRHKIKVSGKLRTVNWLDRQARPLHCGRMIELGSLESPPMRDLAREVEKPSQNLYADLLLAQVGEHARSPQDPPSATSEELGIRELQKFLAEAGVKNGDTIFEEGSGLSRDNLTTPRATVALLRYMSRPPAAEAFISALPIAGVDGTLRNRMKGTLAAGNLRGKTGSLRWTSSLSGYVTSAAGEHLAFSLMLNRYQNTEDVPTHSELDAIAVLLANFTGRSSN